MTPRPDDVDARERGFDLAVAYDRHAAVLLAVAVSALRDRARAEDVVQETFLRAWRARTSFDPRRGALRTWLFAIERNVIVDAVRARARAPVASAVDPDDLRSHPDITPEPDHSDATVERVRLLEALSTLSPDHREVVGAIHIRGLTYAELAASTGTSVATLRTRCFYALRALRARFDAEEKR